MVGALLRSHPEIVVSRSVTTRPPRPTERDGIDYDFITPEQFDKLVDGADVVGMTVREDDADDVLLTQPAQDPLGLRARVEDDGAGLVRERIALGLPRSDGHLFDREHLNAP